MCTSLITPGAVTLEVWSVLHTILYNYLSLHNNIHLGMMVGFKQGLAGTSAPCKIIPGPVLASV